MEYSLTMVSSVLAILGALSTVLIFGSIAFDIFKLKKPWNEVTRRELASLSISIIITIVFGSMALCGPDTIYIRW